MKLNSILEKTVAIFLTLTIMVGIGQVQIAKAASSFSDTKGHWADTDIQKGVGKGFVKGYADGTFKPNQPVTRAEFSRMLNLALGVTLTGNITLNDVNSKDWFYDDVKKAVAAGYIAGYTDNTFKPNNKITRQEAANMISKVLPNYGTTANLYGLSDYGSIASWAKDGVTAVYARGYMKGDNNKMYRPNGSLTRGEACAILVRLVEGEGIITSANYTIDDDDDGDTISKKIFTNNVTIDEDLDDGEVTLDKVVILGTLTVKGGGKNTVSISDSQINKVTIAKASGDVRVLLTGSTNVNEAIVNNGAIVEQKSLTRDGIKKLRLDGSKLEDQEVTLKGNFIDVILDDEALVELTSGKITTLTVNSKAASSVIDLASGTSVTTANVNAKAEFTGLGKISTMNANANDITYETKPSNIVKGSGVTKPPVLAEDNEGPKPTFTPKEDATGIAPNTQIKVVFDEPIYLSGGGRVTNSDIEDIIEVRKSTASGSKIDFDATISSDKKTITIEPDETLSINTYYYIIVLKGTIEDEDKNKNEKFTSKFKTGNQDVAAPTAVFSPANNATNVAINTKITITFSEAIKLSGGKTVTNSSIVDFIELRQDSATGTRKSFSATINSAKRIIEITPSSNLTINKDYYIVVLAGEIEDADGNEVKKITSTFKTGTPTVASPTITTIPTTVTAVANNGTVQVTLATSTSGADIYYTLDGKTPTTSSAHYQTPLNVTNSLAAGQTITVKAIAVKSGMTNSAVASKAITFISNYASAPIITTNPTSESAVPRNESVGITITTSTSGADIYFTLDGSVPTTSSTRFTTERFVDLSHADSNGKVTIKAIVVKDGIINPNVTTKVITFAPNTVDTPTITTDPTNVLNLDSSTVVTVTIYTDTDDADIYYTIDGSTPTDASTLYTGEFPIELSDATAGVVTVKAIAIKEGMEASSVKAKTITFQLTP